MQTMDNCCISDNQDINYQLVLSVYILGEGYAVDDMVMRALPDLAPNMWIGCLAQDCSDSIADALELPQSCIKGINVSWVPFCLHDCTKPQL